MSAPEGKHTHAPAGSVWCPACAGSGSEGREVNIGPACDICGGMGTVTGSTVAAILTQRAALLAALEAIEARTEGVFDHPALVAYGPLGTVGGDCLNIARAAIALAKGVQS